MRRLKEYHHFKEELIDSKDRVAKCERYVVDLLLLSSLPDSERESSACWELKHQATTLQFAKILALKRGLPIDLCTVGLMLHDVHSIVNGKYKEHAHSGTKIATQILDKIGGFTEEEKDQITRIIHNHSDKHIWTDDPFQEIGKDVDVLDCFLYEGAFDYYLGNKPLSIFKHYLKRAKKVWKELEIPPDPRFELLDDYGPNWFELMKKMSLDQMNDYLAVVLRISALEEPLNDTHKKISCPPPFAVLVENNRDAEGSPKPTSFSIYGNKKNWRNYLNLPIVKICWDALAKTTTKHTRTEASKILIQRRGSHEKYALLFWPLIEIYELLLGEHLIARFTELGIEMK